MPATKSQRAGSKTRKLYKKNKKIHQKKDYKKKVKKILKERTF